VYDADNLLQFVDGIDNQLTGSNAVDGTDVWGAWKLIEVFDVYNVPIWIQVEPVWVCECGIVYLFYHSCDIDGDIIRDIDEVGIL